MNLLAMIFLNVKLYEIYVLCFFSFYCLISSWVDARRQLTNSDCSRVVLNGF